MLREPLAGRASQEQTVRATTAKITGSGLGAGMRVPEGYPPALRDHGLLLAGGPGLYGWTGELEQIFKALERALDELSHEICARVLRFPPILSRPVLERSRFAESFPQLFGSVHAFFGDWHDRGSLTTMMAHGDEWSKAMRITDFVLTPAACYPVYPVYADATEAVDAKIDVYSYCFRHEPSEEPGRLVSFRQREFVRIATPGAAQTWFEYWQDKALGFARRLGLDARLEIAADPFFGQGGRLLSASQREQNLKFEVLAEIGTDHWAAIASCNYHRDHFGQAFDIHAEDGKLAHSTCVGFGMERIAQALVSAHGPSRREWPAAVRTELWS